MRFVLRILVVMMLMKVSSASALCERFPSLTAEYKASELVLVATVVREELVPDNEPTFYAGTLYYLKPERWIKGRLVPGLRLFSENTSGRFPMEIGESYLIFANGEKDLYQDSHTYWVDSCGNSKLHSAAKADLRKLSKLK